MSDTKAKKKINKQIWVRHTTQIIIRSSSQTIKKNNNYQKTTNFPSDSSDCWLDDFSTFIYSTVNV